MFVPVHAAGSETSKEHRLKCTTLSTNVQEAGPETMVPLRSAERAAPAADCPEAWDGAAAWATTLAWVSPQVAALQRWRPDDTVLVISSSHHRCTAATAPCSS